MAIKKSNYQEAIKILTSQGKFYINLGLERVQKILELMSNPQRKLKFIHVAGTNGKGSVCAMLSAILKDAKMQSAKVIDGKMTRGQDGKKLIEPAFLPSCLPAFKVGLFTSPHIFEYTERIKINDVEIEKEIFAQRINKIIELADKNQIHLTEFEIITALAFDYFAQNRVDVVVLETGLGGRLDATNVIDDNICSIITHIDLDHTERLGNTIEKIAYEKAGIIKEKCPTIVSKKNAGYEIIKDVALEKYSPVIEVDDVQKISLDDCALNGAYQKENLALVLKAIELLNKSCFNITDEAILEGLKNVKHPCRFEYLEKENIIIDGAHNPNGTKALRASLDKRFSNIKVKFVFGCLNNKNYSEMMDNLFKAGDEIYFYQFDNPNSCSYEELKAVCKFNSKPFNEFKYDRNSLTVICGSFYMIKELLTKMVLK